MSETSSRDRFAKLEAQARDAFVCAESPHERVSKHQRVPGLVVSVTAALLLIAMFVIPTVSS